VVIIFFNSFFVYYSAQLVDRAWANFLSSSVITDNGRISGCRKVQTRQRADCLTCPCRKINHPSRERLDTLGTY